MDPFIARTPVDLLAVVPFSIGFHPEDSVVLLTFDPAGAEPLDRASFHARTDLPLVEKERREVARMLRGVVRKHRVGLVALLLYTNDAAAAQSFAGLLVPSLLRDGVEVIDVIRVVEDRFFSVDDPADLGTPYDLRTHPFTAAQVLDGRVAHENRAALVESLIGTDDEDSVAVGTVADQVVDDLLSAGHNHGQLGEVLVAEARWVQRRIRRYLRTPGPLRTRDAGRLLVMVAFDALREVAWAEMSRADARLHVELWRDLTRRAPEDLRSGAGSLLAFASWLAGDGALACCALDRCFGEDPEDRLAQHVVSLIESATPPSVWAPIPEHALRIFRIEAGTAAS